MFPLQEKIMKAAYINEVISQDPEKNIIVIELFQLKKK
jgi:hypothetical protein